MLLEMIYPHEYYMHLAMLEGEKGRGMTSPNPGVGAVIVQRGTLVGQGYTQPAGQAHAEIQALKQAGAQARGATLYVTLEPCSHYGRTPPCTDQIIKAGIKKVVFGVQDPNPLVNGQGMFLLQKAGIEVIKGVLADQIRRQLEIFLKYITKNRPFVCIKTAASLDGKITLKTNQRWHLSGEEAQAFTHELRRTYDAIMVGTNTVLIDNPQLTCLRGKSPWRVILDRELKIPLTAKVFDQQAQTIVVTAKNNLRKEAILMKAGIEILKIKTDYLGKLNLKSLLEKLATKKISSVLVEGGSTLNAALLRSKLVDKIHFIYTPQLIGGQMTPGLIGGESIDDPRHVLKLKNVSYALLGKDMLVTGYI
jgi:diaminohydroxyphosphoribosylaminopyrimidine deaminase/5-amino-6-(5-phosphoribosylamino)uracil reductase